MKKRKTIKGVNISWPEFAGLALAALILYFIYKEIQKTRGGETEREAEDEVKKRELSYPDGTYHQLADQLFQAFNPNWTGLGTDDDEVFRILNLLKTPSDWFKLVSVYGDKANPLGGHGTLTEWLTSELTSSQMQKASEILQNINVTI